MASDTPSTKIRDYFSKFGPLLEVTRIPGKTFCYVQFLSVNQARTDAIEAKVLSGNHIIDKTRQSDTTVVCSKANPRKSKDGGKDTPQTSKEVQPRDDVKQNELKVKKEDTAAKPKRPTQVVPGSLKDRAYKGLDVKIQQLREKCIPVEVINALETNIDTLMTRLQDVEEMKKKPEYKHYLKKVPRTLREVTHPQTPDMFAKCPMQVWQTRMKDWTESLKEYKPARPQPEPSTSKATVVQPKTSKSKVPTVQPTTSTSKVPAEQPKVLRCNVCKYGATNIKSFQDHLRSAKHNNNKVCILCSLCNSWFPERNYLNHLNSSAHAKELNGQRFDCKPCNIVMKSNQKKNQIHNTTQHLSGRKHLSNAKQIRIPCPVCHMTFDNVDKFLGHLSHPDHMKMLQKCIASGNQDKLMQFSCIPCKFKTGDSNAYQKHLEQQSHLKTLYINSKKTSPFNCTLCKIDLPSSLEFEWHLLSAQHIKMLDGSFICHICNKNCYSKPAFKSHVISAPHREKVMKQHDTIALLSLTCSKCRESYPDQTSFDAHITSDYHDFVCKLKEEKFHLWRCGACNAGLRNLKSVSEHIQDGEHINIMFASGKISCLLCGWQTSQTTKEKSTREYWKHMEEKEHLIHMERLIRTFGSYRNIKCGAKDKLQCGDCKQRFQSIAASHKCTEETRADPKELSTIEVTSTGIYNKVLKSFFSQFGEIQNDLTTKYEGGSQRTSITYRSMESVDIVMEIYRNHDEMTVKGFDLTINRVLPPKVTNDNISSTIFCINLDQSLSRIDLFNYFTKYGAIQEIELVKPSAEAAGFCTIIYKDKKDMFKAYLRGIMADGSCSHTVLKSSVVCKRLDKQSDEGALLLKDIPPSTTSFQLCEYFTKFKYFKSLHMSRDVYQPKALGYGLVKFVSAKRLNEVLRRGDKNNCHKGGFKVLPMTIATMDVKDASKKEAGSAKNAQQQRVSTETTNEGDLGELKDDNLVVVDEWFDEDLEDDSANPDESAASPDVEAIQIPGLDISSEESNKPVALPTPVPPPTAVPPPSAVASYYSAVPPPSAVAPHYSAVPPPLPVAPPSPVPTPALSDAKSKWDVTPDLTVVMDADETLDVDIMGDPLDMQVGGDVYVGDDVYVDELDDVDEDEIATVSAQGAVEQDNQFVLQGDTQTNSAPEDNMFTSIMSVKNTQPLPPGLDPISSDQLLPPGMEPPPEISTSEDSEDPDVILAEVPPPTPPPEIDLTAEEPSKISITLKDVPELDDDGSVNLPAYSSCGQFKVPTFLPPPRKKKGKTVRLGMPPKAMLNAQTMEKASALAPKGPTGVQGILEPEFTSRPAKIPDKSSLATYQLVGLPSNCKEGDVWKYFKAFGLGEIMSISVCKPRNSGIKKSVIRFMGIGPNEHKVLSNNWHRIDGKGVQCILDDEDSSTSGVSKPSASQTQKGKEFSLKIPEILKANPGWKGTNRGIEYVIAGYLCNVCQWFYKARKDVSHLMARLDHQKSSIHAKDRPEKQRKRAEYGVEGVYCKVCSEFVPSKAGQKAVEAAMHHCSILKHHLNIKLYILNNNLKEPKWLKNPLYTEGKKRKFTEGLSATLNRRPQVAPPGVTEDSLALPGETQRRSSDRDQLAPPGEAESTGLAIVAYDSSDEEDLWTDAMS